MTATARQQSRRDETYGPHDDFRRDVEVAKLVGLLLAFPMIASPNKPASIIGILILAMLSRSFGTGQRALCRQRIQAFGSSSCDGNALGVSIRRCAILSRRIAIMWKFTLPILLVVVSIFELGIYLAPERSKPEFTDLKLIFLLILLICGARDFFWRRQLQIAFTALRSLAIPKS